MVLERRREKGFGLWTYSFSPFLMLANLCLHTASVLHSEIFLGFEPRYLGSVLRGQAEGERADLASAK